MKPDLASVVTAHMVYFCAFARSEIFLENTRKSGVGRGQFDAGVNGLTFKKSVMLNHIWKGANGYLIEFTLDYNTFSFDIMQWNTKYTLGSFGYSHVIE